MIRARRRVATTLALAGFAAAAAAPSASAQRATRRPPPRPELRLDYLGPEPHALHLGAGVNLPAGTYVRLGLVGGAGAAWRDGASGTSARADVIARFAFDPFRERRWGFSAGGGLSTRYDQDRDDSGRRRGRWRALVALLLDLEGPRAGSLAPAVQIGLGGGARGGVILRAADRSRR